MNTMKWLVKREFWENKGGFFWAPIVVGCIATVFATIAATVGAILGHNHGINVDDDPIEKARVFGAIGDGALLGGFGLALAVLAFVVFFYALGSLYDDRRDRSILFWKSMPISDEQMVLSKAAWALLLAPIVSLAIGLLIGLVFWVIAFIATSATGVGGTSAMISESHPFRVVAGVLVALPVQILWSLPAVGWLMLCSAWSRRVPFLWATAVPIMTCAMISFTDIFPGVELDHKKLWYTVVYRGLLSIVPGSWLPTIPVNNVEVNGPEDLSHLFNVFSSWQVFAHADVWIGAVLGVAMIYAAIRLRRWRDEG